jgi:hypothetical protein
LLVIQEEVRVRVPALPARLALWLVLSALLTATTVFAQAGTASVTGTITDEQGAALPGVTVTISNAATGLLRSTTTDDTGVYQLLSLPPGTYQLKVELNGFRTAVLDAVRLPVDTVARQDAKLSIGSLSETVEVTAETTVMNTTDASLGNVITGNQVRALPLEARNVVGLLSLQPGAVYVPNTLSEDPRSGAVSGARADQANVTLDGIDVNDPQFNSAYSSAVRVTLDALEEFRVTTSNYGADSGRSSAAQVSLVTRSGTNNLHGSGYYLGRETAWSSKEYFLGLSGQDKAKLDKKIFGGSVGGPILKDKLFFFGNYERLQESSESPVLRDVPSDTLRDGVLVYGCADPGACPATTVQGLTASHAIDAGFHGLSPAELTAIDPLHIGPSLAAMDVFNQYPHPNDPGTDGFNLVGFRFASPIENRFNTTIGRIDFRPSGNHSFFGRFNVQNDSVAETQQFPGQDPRHTNKIKNRGFALGHDWVLGSNKVNTFRYGFSEIVSDSVGLQTASVVNFRFIDDFNALTATSGRRTPTHNFVDDFSWVKGSHTLKFGTNMRFSRIPSYTNINSFNFATTNASWMAGVGTTYAPGQSCPGTEDACASLPAVSEDYLATFADAFAPVMGMVSQTSRYANYLVDGTVLPEGEAVRRKYGSDEYEFYVQDSWKLSDSLTVTGGLRYSLYSPPWEVNGQQVAPTVNLGDLFDQRAKMMAAGIPDNTLPLIGFDLAGAANNRPGYYDWDKNNFAPRIAAAWTPRADGGFFGWLTGGNRMVVRGGYSLVYDRIGQALAANFDEVGSFGLSTIIDSAVNQNNEDNPDIRFVAIDQIPNTIPDAPPGGFPQTPPVGLATITSGLDPNITTPYAHTFNLVVGRELRDNFSIEAAYVGRRGRNLLMRRDLMMPLNLVDPQSGMDYFTAARQLIEAYRANGVENVAPIPYFENLFPDAAFDGFTATQNMAAEFEYYDPDWQTALWDIDQFCTPACTKYGPFSYFNQQYFSLAGQSSIARADYNALQLTLRKRWSNGYQFDFNYTLSHAQDHGSSVEKGSFFTTDDYDSGGYTGFAINSWNPDQQYADADFDVRHQLNANWVVELPFGRGKPLGTDAPGWLNAAIGEWSVAGLWRWTSGFPFVVINCRSCWATNWNLQGNAELVTPGVLPETRTTKNAVNGLPSPFANPSDAITYFRRDFPGESGLRNVLRGDGYFTIDLSIAKGWTMPWSGDQRLRFTWDIFNLTNTPKFDVGNLTNTPDRASTFGTYNGTLTSCDGGAGRCMQFMLRYQF